MKLMKKTVEVNWISWFVGAMILLSCMLFSVLTLIVTLEPTWGIVTGLATIGGLVWRDLDVNLDD